MHAPSPYSTSRLLYAPVVYIEEKSSSIWFHKVVRYIELLSQKFDARMNCIIILDRHAKYTGDYYRVAECDAPVLRDVSARLRPSAVRVSTPVHDAVDFLGAVPAEDCGTERDVQRFVWQYADPVQVYCQRQYREHTSAAEVVGTRGGMRSGRIRDHMHAMAVASLGARNLFPRRKRPKRTLVSRLTVILWLF